jgi:hypothetical protein
MPIRDGAHRGREWRAYDCAVELHQLRAFVQVTHAGTFTRAAEELHLTQSAVSNAVGRLEAELGHRLLHRGARGVELTEAGAVVFERAREIVAGADAIRSDLGAFSGLREGTVGLGTMLPPGPLNLPELLGSTPGSRGCVRTCDPSCVSSSSTRPDTSTCSATTSSRPGSPRT